MHAGLVAVIVVILLCPQSSIVLEKRGLGPGDCTRPGDIVVLVFWTSLDWGGTLLSDY